MAAWETNLEKLLNISQKIISLQDPIRILNSIKWRPEIYEKFSNSKFKEMPNVGPEYYESISLGFETDQRTKDFQELRALIPSKIDFDPDLAELLTKTVDDYISVISLLKNRGKKEFWNDSKILYGSPKDKFHGDRSVTELGRQLYEILGRLNGAVLGPPPPRDRNAQETVDLLRPNLENYFGKGNIIVELSDEILADSAAGGDRLKIRTEGMFSQRLIDLLEVHEGWVHVGTTLNGLEQKVAKFLSKGPPRITATQEGLAVLMEIITFRSYPDRAKRINDRILAIDKSEDGANFLEVFEFFRVEGYPESECFHNSVRVFRGGMVEGGAPFTKDISYCVGFINNYNFIRTAIRAGKPEIIPFLFAGKVNLDDIPLLYRKHLEGLIDAPKYIPPQFRDLSGLSVWMSFSSFLNQIDLSKVQKHFDDLFKRHL